MRRFGMADRHVEFALRGKPFQIYGLAKAMAVNDAREIAAYRDGLQRQGVDALHSRSPNAHPR